METDWERVPFPLLRIDSEGVVLDANAAACSELHRPAPRGERFADLLPGGLPEALDGAEVELPEGLVRLSLRRSDPPGTDSWLTWAASAPPSSAARPTTEAPSGARILVAEDEDSIRDICRRVLTDAGYRVLVAANGQTAIDILQHSGEHIDLVLADVVMPVAGGEAIFDFLRRSELSIPIIFTSGYARRGTPAEFLDGAGITLLRKPYTLAQLLACVRGALNSGPG